MSFIFERIESKAIAEIDEVIQWKNEAQIAFDMTKHERNDANQSTDHHISSKKFYSHENHANRKKSTSIFVNSGLHVSQEGDWVR